MSGLRYAPTWSQDPVWLLAPRTPGKIPPQPLKTLTEDEAREGLGILVGAINTATTEAY
jgi:hypothetical protein